jgi:hypothetical protein
MDRVIGVRSQSAITDGEISPKFIKILADGQQPEARIN